MKILFYFGHPAQFMMLRQTIHLLKEKGWKVKIVIKTKDVLEALLKDSGLEYENILQKGRRDNSASIFLAILKRDFRLFQIVRKFKPKLMIGTDPSIAHVSWLLRIYSITIVEDDYHVIRNLVRITYPFTKTILCPQVCEVGNYEKKKTGYAGYMKLGYLHPAVFVQDQSIIEKYNFASRFILIRLSALNAYHDYGIGGITSDLLVEIISVCNSYGYEIKLSTEFELEQQFLRYKMDIEIKDMHHVLSAASLLVSDSQSMSVEAAMLGVPSIRYSGFAGKISVLEELENSYGLTFGIPIGSTAAIFTKLNDFLSDDNLYEEFQQRRTKMLSEKINLTSFLLWFIEGYPQSVKTMKENPDYQYNFK